MAYPEDFDDILIEDEQDLDSFEQGVRVACLIHALEAEVNNGGFDQFFLNSSGRFALQTIEALDEIGAKQTAELLQSAISIAYPDGYPDDPEEHEETDDSDEALDALNQLDEQFYEYREPLTDLVNRYLEEEQTEDEL